MSGTVTLTSADGRAVSLTVGAIEILLASRRAAPVETTDSTSILDEVLAWDFSTSAVEWYPPPMTVSIDDGQPRNRQERRRMAKTGRR